MKKLTTIDKSSDNDYNAEFEYFKSRIVEAQSKSLYKVNVEQLHAYYDIGKKISENLNTQHWGSKVMDKLVEYFQVELPGISGLNRRNLYYMKTFYEMYCEDSFEFVPEPLAQLTWTHHREILDVIKTRAEAHFYLKYSINNGLSSGLLRESLRSNEYHNNISSQNNYQVTTKHVDQSNLIVGDITNLDFLLLAKDHKERELEDGIVKNIVKFLTKMNGKIAFVGRQFPVKFTEKQYFIDLLFFHVDLNSYIVFELKASEFKPDHIGQLALYLGAVNKELKKETHNPTIGILLCQSKDRVEVEYILNTINTPIGVTTYSYTDLPKEISQYLPSKDDLIGLSNNNKNFD